MQYLPTSCSPSPTSEVRVGDAVGWLKNGGRRVASLVESICYSFVTRGCVLADGPLNDWGGERVRYFLALPFTLRAKGRPTPGNSSRIFDSRKRK